MVNKNKRKGTRWERELASELEEHASKSRRIPGSGALGTTLVDPRLTGDVFLTYEWLNKPIKVEAKYGYGTSKSMRIQREWMEKICEESEANNSLPMVAIKFRDVTTGHKSAKWICFSLEDWNNLAEYLNELFDDLEEFWEWKYSEKEK